MKKFNPFRKVDMEIGSFIEKSRFNKDYGEYDNERKNEEIKNTEGKNRDKGGR